MMPTSERMLEKIKYQIDSMYILHGFVHVLQDSEYDITDIINSTIYKELGPYSADEDELDALVGEMLDDLLEDEIYEYLYRTKKGISFLTPEQAEHATCYYETDEGLIACIKHCLEETEWDGIEYDESYDE